jgi:threonine synthase
LKDPEYTIDFHRGSLLTDDETAAMPAAQRTAIEILARAPIVLEPSVEAVMHTLDAAVRDAEVRA